MGPVWALLVLLSFVQGVEGYCDARQNNITCYGALGGTVEIRLMDALKELRCIWKKKSKNIFDTKVNRLADELKLRSVFSANNGTFQIHNLTRNDSDTYNLELTYLVNGTRVKKLTHELLIQAPVSSVMLKLECLSKGEVRATCSARGDSPQYIWTLNGQNLTDQIIFKNSEKNFTLRQKGLLRCSAKNHISDAYEEKNIPTCGYIFINCTLQNGTHISDWVYELNNTLCIEPTTVSTTITTTKYWPAIISALAVIVLIAGVGLICVLKKRCKKEKDEGQEQELTYADVRILQQPGRQPPQTPEVEVEYGQVKFSNHSQQVSEGDIASIYAKVRK